MAKHSRVEGPKRMQSLMYLGILPVFFRGLHPRVLPRTFLDTLPVENSFEAGPLGVGHFRLPWPR